MNLPLRRISTRRKYPAAALLLALLAVVCWELLVRVGSIPEVFFPAPSAVVAALFRSVSSGEMPSHLGATLARVGPGLIAGGLAGLLAGLLIGGSPRVRAVADPFVAAFHPIPKLALLPLFMVVLGIGEAPKIVLVAVAAFFPMLINTAAGVRQINPVHLEVARNYGAGKMTVLRRVILPASLPMTLAGLRLSANLALVITIAVEMISSETGLGALVWLAWQLLRVELLYAALLVTALLGIGLNASLRRLELRLAPWQTVQPL